MAKPFRRSIVAAFFLVALASASAQVSKLPHASQPDFADSEDGCLDGRVEDYLRRHGDHGLMDPAVMLELSRDVHAKLEAERQTKHATSIGGDVWNSIGPSNGAGRATAIAVDPTLPNTMIVGAAGGGAWKTTDGGNTWAPLTETIPNLSVGAIALARSSPSTVYLGTGEGGAAGDFIPGIGLLASSDGGATWTLPPTVIASQFYKISVHPTSPQELVIATNAGALRSTTGQGGPWKIILSHDTYGDVTDLLRDPSNPQILYAATWDRLAWCASHTCSASRNYAGSTVLKSTDGGQTWNPANAGLPSSTATQYVSRIALAIAPSSTSTIYAATSVVDQSNNGNSHIYKSVDGGASWTETALSSNSNRLINYYHKGGGDQVWYDNTIVVSPTDPNTVIAGGVYYVRSTDGGTTWSRAFATSNSSVHVDAHELAFTSAGTLVIANDGGIFTSTDAGVSATDRNAGLVTRQYYTLSNDATTAGRAFGGMQDNGTNRRHDATGTTWDTVAGGDGFGCAVVPTAPSVLVVSYQNVALNRTSASGDSPVNLINASPAMPSSEKKPFASVIVNDPIHPAVMYTVSTRVWRSADAGDSWLPLPIATSDGKIWDMTAAGEISSLAIAKSNPAVMMVTKGYDNANKTFNAAIFRSSDGGNTWSMTNSGLPSMYPTSVEIDPTNPNIAYVTLSTLTGNSVFKTINGGASWSPSSSGLPSFPAQVIRVDPTDPNALYCGTDVGVYRSTDQGGSWSRFGTGMPAVCVYDIRASDDGSILRAVTHGRGAWELTVTGTANHPPVATVTSPVAVNTTRGASVSFSGSVSDPDSGDSATSLWTFPDTWETAQGLTATHTFTRAGTFPVTLFATDTHGATASAASIVKVAERGDDCGSAVVVPAAGPFPWSISVDTSAASTQRSDPGMTVAPASCYPYQPYTTEWLSFTPQTSGTYDFYACGSRVTTVVELWTGAACGPYTPVASACQIINPGTDCGSDPKLSVALTAGTTYRIMVVAYYYQGPITLTVNQGPIATQVAAIAPASGGASGGTPVVITGSAFASPASVTIGGVAATSVNVISPSLLTAVTGAHAAGSTDVVVTTGGSTGTLSDAFVYTGSAPTTCVPSASQLCFVSNRYAVTLTASDSARTGKTATGEANVETADTGYFTLSALTGSTQNPEVVVKVLEVAPGQPWVFFGGLTDLEYLMSVVDTQTGQVRQYHKIAGSVQNGYDTGGGQLPQPETVAGSVCPSTPSSTTTTSVAPGACVPSSTALCLVGNRFKVEVTARDAGRTNAIGAGQTRPKNDIFGYFSVPSLTGNPNNQEIFVKILDARAFTGKFWIFYGTLSDFEFTVKVTDTATGQVKTYLRPGQTACGAADTTAFPF